MGIALHTKNEYAGTLPNYCIQLLIVSRVCGAPGISFRIALWSETRMRKKHYHEKLR